MSSAFAKVHRFTVGQKVSWDTKYPSRLPMSLEKLIELFGKNPVVVDVRPSITASGHSCWTIGEELEAGRHQLDCRWVSFLHPDRVVLRARNDSSLHEFPGEHFEQSSRH